MTDFDKEAFERHLKRERMDLTIFNWDPRLHPRNLLGQFREVLDGLDDGDTLELPDGTYIDKGNGKYVVGTGSDPHPTVFDNPDDAIEEAAHLANDDIISNDDLSSQKEIFDPRKYGVWDRDDVLKEEIIELPDGGRIDMPDGTWVANLGRGVFEVGKGKEGDDDYRQPERAGAESDRKPGDPIPEETWLSIIVDVLRFADDDMFPDPTADIPEDPELSQMVRQSMNDIKEFRKLVAAGEEEDTEEAFEEWLIRRREEFKQDIEDADIDDVIDRITDERGALNDWLNEDKDRDPDTFEAYNPPPGGPARDAVRGYYGGALPGEANLSENGWVVFSEDQGRAVTLSEMLDPIPEGNGDQFVITPDGGAIGSNVEEYPDAVWFEVENLGDSGWLVSAGSEEDDRFYDGATYEYAIELLSKWIAEIRKTEEM